LLELEERDVMSRSNAFEAFVERTALTRLRQADVVLVQRDSTNLHQLEVTGRTTNASDVPSLSCSEAIVGRACATVSKTRRRTDTVL
jgi:hypothetical protein